MRKISVSSSPRVLWRLPLQIEHDVIILSAIIVKIYCCLCSSGMEKRIKKLRTYNPGKNIWPTPSKIVKSRKFWYLLFPNFQSLFVQYVIHFGGEAECRAVCAHPNWIWKFKSRFSILLLRRQSIYFYDGCMSNYGVFFVIASCHWSHPFMEIHRYDIIYGNLWSFSLARSDKREVWL